MQLTKDSKIGIFLGGTSGLGKELELQLREQKKIDYSIILGSSIKYPEAHTSQMLVPCDLRFPEKVEVAFDTLFHFFNSNRYSPTHFVWAAGIGEKQPYFEQTATQRRLTFGVNFDNALPLAELALHFMLQGTKTFKTLLVLGSTSSDTPRADEINYAAAHAAKRMWTVSQQIALYSSDKNIYVPYAYLGGIKTPFWDSYRKEHPEFEETYEQFNDPAKVAAFLISETNKAVPPNFIQALRGQFV